jgi:hypothetical protein
MHLDAYTPTCLHPVVAVSLVTGKSEMKAEWMRGKDRGLVNGNCTTELCGPDGGLFVVRDGPADVVQSAAQTVNGQSHILTNEGGLQGAGAGHQVATNQRGVGLGISVAEARVDAGNCLVQPVVDGSGNSNF